MPKEESEPSRKGFKVSRECYLAIEEIKHQAKMRGESVTHEQIIMGLLKRPANISDDRMSPDAAALAVTEIEQHAQAITRAASVVRTAMAGRRDSAHGGKARQAKTVAVPKRA